MGDKRPAEGASTDLDIPRYVTREEVEAMSLGQRFRYYLNPLASDEARYVKRLEAEVRRLRGQVEKRNRLILEKNRQLAAAGLLPEGFNDGD